MKQHNIDPEVVEMPQARLRCPKCGTHAFTGFVCPKCPVDDLEPHGADGTCETGDCGLKPETAGWARLDMRLDSAEFKVPKSPELSLLFVVLGENEVAVKVEQAQDAPDGKPYALVMDGFTRGVLVRGNVFVANDSFADIRVAIDKQFGEGEKPVPRIERVGADHLRVWSSYEAHPTSGVSLTKTFNIRDDDYDALCELAGKPLPIYEPKRGKWERLIPFQVTASFGSTPDTVRMHGGAGIEVWRFTLESK